MKSRVEDKWAVTKRPGDDWPEDEEREMLRENSEDLPAKMTAIKR